MTFLVTDTHPLIWYINNDVRKLPKRVRKAFDDAVEGRIAIWVPIVVVWEISLLVKGGRIQIVVPLDEFVSNGFFSKAIHSLDLTPEDIFLAHALNFSKDPFDTVIVAMALRLGCPLITADSLIHSQKPCELFWD